MIIVLEAPELCHVDDAPVARRCATTSTGAFIGRSHQTPRHYGDAIQGWRCAGPMTRAWRRVRLPLAVFAFGVLVGAGLTSCVPWYPVPAAHSIPS